MFYYISGSIIGINAEGLYLFLQGLLSSASTLCMYAMYLTSLTDCFDDRTFSCHFHLMIVFPHRHNPKNTKNLHLSPIMVTSFYILFFSETTLNRVSCKPKTFHVDVQRATDCAIELYK